MNKIKFGYGEVNVVTEEEILGNLLIYIWLFLVRVGQDPACMLNVNIQSPDG